MTIGEKNSSSAFEAEEEQIRLRKPRNVTDPIPSTIQSTRSKPTISSLLLSSFTPNNNITTTSDDTPITTTTIPKKKYFTGTKFRGLGCTAPAQVSVPAVIRTSANWEGKKVRKKKQKKNKNSGSSGNQGGSDGGMVVMSSNSHLSAPAPATAGSSSCLVVPDVWCGPGIGFSTDAASVDCVVSRRPVSGRGKVDGERINIRERSSCGGRRMVHPDDLSFFDAEPGVPHPRLDVFGSRYHRHIRHRSPEGLAEIVMLQGNLVMGGRLDHDRFKDWRLDVDRMSYEELLELGDKIGYVCTGLKENEIRKIVKKIKPPVTRDKSSPGVQPDMQWKCTICQEEYEGDDEMGKLDCGHYYHMYCIKQWLLQKKTCPVCKTSVVAEK